MSSIIMPPPAPINPQMKPIVTPQTNDWIIRLRGETCCISSLVVITGRTINLTPSRKVMNTENDPIVADGSRLAI